jgi:NAD(P)-dependent dehydrogenase (short-subunit alcohol dehydrogenase family)
MAAFSGKVALVTGAASGIGKATALAFLREGAKVVSADIVEPTEDLGLFVKCDVSKEAEVKALIKKCIDTYGRLDCAFNNAGVEGKTALITDCTEESWDRIIDTNLKSVWLCMKYQIPYMLRQGGGSIVNCASIAGLVGFAGSVPYVASKHGIVGITKAAALEFAKAKIRINAVCPGVIQTPMIDRSVAGNPQMKALLTSGEPVGRVGQPEEIASAVLWLCSDGASFVTGHPLAVDGGWVAQ